MRFFYAICLLVLLLPLGVRGQMFPNPKKIKRLAEAETGLTLFGPSNALLPYSQEIGGKLLFFYGGEPWVTDGTETGTTLVKDLLPGPDPSALGFEMGTPVFYRGSVYYRANSKISFGGLCRTDGTATGTEVVPGISLLQSRLTVFNDKLYFFASAGQTLALYASDGTAAGTKKLKELYTNTTGQSFYPLGGSLYFFVDSASPTRYELWKTDGTETGTVRVKEMEAYAPARVVGDATKFFFFQKKSNKTSVWRSDGSANGTVELSALGEVDIRYEQFLEFLPTGNLTFPSIVGTELKLMSADAGQTKATALSSLLPGSYGKTNGTLYYQTQNGGVLGPLFQTDGTPGGTKAVPNPPTATIDNVFSLNGRTYVVCRPLLYRVDEQGALQRLNAENSDVLVKQQGRAFVGELGGKVLFIGNATDAGDPRFSPAETLYELPLSSCTLSATVGGNPLVSCTGTPVTLQAKPAGGTTPYAYLWKRDGTALPTQTTDLSTATAGSYTVEVTDAKGCKSTAPAFAVTKQKKDTVTIIGAGVVPCGEA